MTARNWFFTGHYDLDTPVETVLDGAEALRHALIAEQVVGAIYQIERCPTTNRLHLQGKINYKSAVRISKTVKLLEDVGCIGPHVDKTVSEEGANKYCAKEETRLEGTEPYEIGDIKKAGQGKRNELAAVKALIDNGATETEVADQFFGAWCRNHKAFERYRQLKAAPRSGNDAIEVEMMVGPPGCGKTRAATEENPGCYIKGAGTGAWFDMYDPVIHKCVVFDDFYGNIPYSQLLNLLDRYACKVECKGGVLNFTATKIVLTSNRTHIVWYQKMFEENKGDPNAFVRRVTRWRFWVRVGNTFEERSTADYEEFSAWCAAHPF